MDINRILDDYTNWLRSEISVANFGEYYELTTPYLDRFNDYLQIYVKAEEDGKISITDDGQILSNLQSVGIKFKAGSRRKKLLDKTLANYGIELNGNDLQTKCTIKNFAQAKHMMVQAMLAVDDLFFLKQENIKDIFIDDIADFFQSNEIFYSPDFSLLGKTGSFYTYDFHFQKSRTKPERFCRGINKLSESNRNMAIFNWIDTKERRAGDSQLIIMVNDQNKVDETDIEALKTYDIEPVLFSKKEENIEKFAS